MSDKNSGVFPRFFVEAVEDKAASKEAGRPIFKDQEMVEVRIAGDKNNVPVFKVKDHHRERWPEAYARFQQGQEQVAEGTPLEQWAVMTRSKAEELKALGIMTVEALADLPDSAIHRIGMGARELMAQAVAFLANAEEGAQVGKLAAENVELKEQVKLLQSQFSGVDELENLRQENEALKAEIDKLKAAPKKVARKKAAPKKVAEAE